MTSTTIRILTIVAAVGSGLVAGVLFAFSTFVMNALRHISPPDGLTAMQSINRFAVTPLFMLTLFGTAGACAALGVWSASHVSDRSAVWCMVGCGLYLAAILVTVAYHVPHNDALAKLDPRSSASAAQWSRYISGWTAWNHVRTAAALVASVLLTVAVRVG